MAIAIGTDYWLYARAGVCNVTGNGSGTAGTAGTASGDRREQGGLTHSGLWRVCCLEGLKRGVCLRINHFPEDLEYDHDSAEYLLRVVRASSIFPILSAALLLLGGVCVAASRLRRARTGLVLGAGILFVAAGLSNIIGVIVYISANAGGEGSAGSFPSPRRDGAGGGAGRAPPYSYGWSFYFGGVSFILAEAIGVLAVNLYIERHRKSPPPPAPPPPPRAAPPPPPPQPSFPAPPRPRPHRRRSRSGSRSGESPPPPPRGRATPPPPPPAAPPPPEISMYTLSREAPLPHPAGQATPTAPPPPGTPGPPPAPPPAEGGTGTLNRKTTPV